MPACTEIPAPATMFKGLIPLNAIGKLTTDNDDPPSLHDGFDDLG